MGIKVLNTEIFDNAVKNEEGEIQPSGVSVGVTILFDDVTYTLDFQTTSTGDYGAYSSTLESYDGNSDHHALEKKVEDEDEFLNLLAEIKIQAEPETVWSDYMNEKYSLSSESFDGMDGNSEVNKATVK
jgi:hypothetical protein